MGDDYAEGEPLSSYRAGSRNPESWLTGIAARTVTVCATTTANGYAAAQVLRQGDESVSTWAA